MNRVLIAYRSHHGQTREIAEAMAKRARSRGLEVELVDAHRQEPPAPARFDAVVLGSSVHAGRHAREIFRYAREHREALSAKPSGCFSVSLSAASHDPKIRDDAKQCLYRFLFDTGWRPRHATTFGGALRFTQYGFLLRFVMKRISQKMGGATDTKVDHDYTDWLAVDRFMDELADELLEAQPGAPRPPAQAPGARPEDVLH